MERRTFLRNTSISLGAVTLPSLGCASVSDEKGRASKSDAGSVESSYRVGDQHLVHGPEGSIYRIDPHEHGVHAVGPNSTHEVMAGFGDDGDEVNFPIDAAVGADGTVYVVDHGNHRVAIFDRDGRAVGKTGELLRPRGVIVSRDDEVLVCDSASHEIDVFDRKGKPTRTMSIESEAETFSPCAIAEDSKGNFHVVDSGGCRIVVFSPDGTVLRSYGEHGDAEGQFFHPRAIAIDPGDRVCVGEAGTGLVTVFDLEGRVLERFPVLSEDGEPVAPLELTIDPEGRLYVWAPEIHHPASVIEG